MCWIISKNFTELNKKDEPTFPAGGPLGHLFVFLPPGALARLRAVYPNLLRVSRDNRAARSLGQLPAMEEAAAQSPLELFAAFYERRNGAPLSSAQKDILQKLIADIWEGEGCGQ